MTPELRNVTYTPCSTKSKLWLFIKLHFWVWNVRTSRWRPFFQVYEFSIQYVSDSIVSNYVYALGFQPAAHRFCSPILQKVSSFQDGIVTCSFLSNGQWESSDPSRLKIIKCFLDSFKAVISLFDCLFSFVIRHLVTTWVSPTPF